MCKGKKRKSSDCSWSFKEFWLRLKDQQRNVKQVDNAGDVRLSIFGYLKLSMRQELMHTPDTTVFTYT